MKKRSFKLLQMDSDDDTGRKFGKDRFSLDKQVSLA